jgi:hypothetical protein
VIEMYLESELDGNARVRINDGLLCLPPLRMCLALVLRVFFRSTIVFVAGFFVSYSYFLLLCWGVIIIIRCWLFCFCLIVLLICGVSSRVIDGVRLCELYSFCCQA